MLNKKATSQKQDLDFTNSMELNFGLQHTGFTQGTLPLKSLESEFTWLTSVFYFGTVI